MKRHSPLHRSRIHCRQGGAVVEMAICLPVLLIIALGSIESANAIFLKQTLTSITYEGAREASAPGGTTDAAEALCEQLMTARRLTGFEIEVTEITADTAPGTPITVRLSAPVSNNSVGVTRFFSSTSMSSEVTMPKL